MEKPKASTLAWAGIGAYEGYALLRGDGQTLSEGLDKFCDSENRVVKWGTRIAIGYTALHLMNVLPKRYDLFHRFTELGK